MAMFRLLQAGLVAMCWQLCLVLPVIAGVTLLVGGPSPHEIGAVYAGTGDHEVEAPKILPLIGWAYLLSAVGVALTRTQSVDVTAAHIRRASRALYPLRPEFAARTVMAQLAVPAIGCGILALRVPAHDLIDVCDRVFGIPSLAAIIWSGLFSILVAGFGANAHAAARAAHG